MPCRAQLPCRQTRRTTLHRAVRTEKADLAKNGKELLSRAEADDVAFLGRDALAFFVDGREGQKDAHGRALAQDGFDHRLAAMHRGKGLDQREAESGSFLRTNLLALDLLERPTEPFQI